MGRQEDHGYFFSSLQVKRVGQSSLADAPFAAPSSFTFTPSWPGRVAPTEGAITVLQVLEARVHLWWAHLYGYALMPEGCITDFSVNCLFMHCSTVHLWHVIGPPNNGQTWSFRQLKKQSFWPLISSLTPSDAHTHTHTPLHIALFVNTSTNSKKGVLYGQRKKWCWFIFTSYHITRDGYMCPHLHCLRMQCVYIR